MKQVQLPIMKGWFWCFEMWIQLSPPINSPLVNYKEEWMSIYDYTGYTQGGNPDRFLLNSFDVVFSNQSIMGEETIFMITLYVYDDSIWLTNFREWSIMPYSLNVLLDVQSIQFDLPDYVYWIGRVNNFADLRKRSTDIRKKRKHNFKTMSFWG